jgi:hypothetical protein
VVCVLCDFETARLELTSMAAYYLYRHIIVSSRTYNVSQPRFCSSSEAIHTHVRTTLSERERVPTPRHRH